MTELDPRGAKMLNKFVAEGDPSTMRAKIAELEAKRDELLAILEVAAFKMDSEAHYFNTCVFDEMISAIRDKIKSGAPSALAYTSILAALRKAEKPSRELDAQIICALNPDETRPGHDLGYVRALCGDHHWRERSVAELTESIDAARTLVSRELPGWFGDVDFAPCPSASNLYGARLFPPDSRNGGNFEGEAKHPALALLIAFFTALVAQGGAK